VGKEIVDQVLDKVRRQSEQCTGLQVSYINNNDYENDRPLGFVGIFNLPLLWRRNGIRIHVSVDGETFRGLREEGIC